MPIVTPANNWTVGLSKNAGGAEGVIGTVATYEFPLYDGRPQPAQDTARIEVTDAASVVGSPYKKPGEHVEASYTIPAFANVVGAQVQSLWPTDTVIGSGSSSTKTITAATQTTGTVTFTAASHGFTNGNYIIVTGMTPATYNGIHLISNVATNTFDVVGFATTLTTPATVFGTAIKPPYAHVFTGLGGSQSWYTMYSTAPGSMLETFEDCIGSSIGFAVTEEGGPLRVAHSMIGKRPTKAAHTITTSPALTDGFLTMVGGTIKYDEDTATPGAQTNVQKVAVVVDRTANPLATADAVNVNYIGQGKVDPSFTATDLYSTWDAYQATFYGSASGTAPSSTLPSGSLELDYVHSIQASWGLKVLAPNAKFMAVPPQPDPSGGPLTLQINGFIDKPTSGDHVQIVLCNNVASY